MSNRAPTASPVVALLATLVLIFAFQADNLTAKWFAVILLAIPILVQVYFNSSLTYMLMRLFKVPHNVASPGALIGQEFEIQGIRFLGTEECRPCYWMNEAFRDERAEEWLKGNGGLRARILADGLLRRDV